MNEISEKTVQSGLKFEQLCLQAIEYLNEDVVVHSHKRLSEDEVYHYLKQEKDGLYLFEQVVMKRENRPKRYLDLVLVKKAGNLYSSYYIEVMMQNVSGSKKERIVDICLKLSFAKLPNPIGVIIFGGKLGPSLLTDARKLILDQITVSNQEFSSFLKKIQLAAINNKPESQYEKTYAIQKIAEQLVI